MLIKKNIKTLPASKLYYYFVREAWRKNTISEVKAFGKRPQCDKSALMMAWRFSLAIIRFCSFLQLISGGD